MAKRHNVQLRVSVLETPFTKKSLIYLELLYLFVVFFLVSNVGVPHAAVYLLDLINLIAVLAVLRGCSRTFRAISYGPVIAVFALLCAILVISDVLNMVRLPLVLFTFRNTFRFFGFFITCVVLLEMDDVRRILNIFFIVQVLNVAISLYQFFIWGVRQDSLGGVFGTSSGCNGFSNVFFCILLAYYSIAYLSGKERFWKFAFVCASTLMLAAMAELRFYYFEFALIALIAAMLYRPKVRAFMIILLAVGALAGGLYALSQFFPREFEIIADLDKLSAYLTQGIADYQLGRLGAFGKINSLVFLDDLGRILFGVGFGGAEYSSEIGIFTSDFSLTWSYLNYRWFAHQMWYIEVGGVGFALFVLLFIVHAVYSGALIKRHPQHEAMLQFVILMTAVTIINLWYNCAIRTEAAYMTFFVLSISCIVAKEKVTDLKKRPKMESKRLVKRAG